MSEKKKRSNAIYRLSDSGNVGLLIYSVFMVIFTITISISVPLLLSFPSNSDQRNTYRFCLATATSDSCVRSPETVFGKKISRKPDKLLDFFGSIPERVQQQWRVWVMDEEKSETIELTVAEFYEWVESYRVSRANEN